MLIRLAGIVTIERDDAPPHHLSSAQAQVAFARLTLERAGGTGRDQLADTIWPDGLPDTWASALRSVVSRVRAFVAGTQTSEVPALVAQGGLYLLRLPSDVSVDLECAERAVGEAIEAFAAGSFVDAQRLAASAVSCLQCPFLPDLEGEWVSGIRERLDELLLSGLETASLAASALGDEHNALRFADTAIRRAPLRESSYRCRMNAHVAAGNRAEALRSYHQLQRILAEELGIDPAPETQEAYVNLLGSPVASSNRTSSRSRPGPDLAAPFVGRHTELATLDKAWSQAENGASRMILITGESGSGKTRLVTEAARRISLADGVVIYGRCDRSSTGPGGPFVEALGGFVAATPDDLMPELSDATRQTLAALVGEPRHGLAETASSTRTELRSALTELLLRVAHDRPVFLVLEDIDLADDDTLMILRQVFRSRSGISLLIVATAGACRARPDRFLATLRDIDREGWLHRVALGGLKEPDVATLVRQVRPETSASAACDPPSPHQLIADTAGNAYLLLELLRWHGDQEDGVEPTCRGMTAGIHEYAKARLAALDPAPRQLLRTAAVAGRSFELDLTAEAAELDADHAMDALDVLLAKGMVTEVFPATHGQQNVHEYRFTQDVLRRAVYQQFSEARRRWLHTRLADAIEFRRAGDPNRYRQTLAHHRAAGDAPHGDQHSVRWGWRAAARATRDGAPHEAVRLYRQALDRVPASNHELRAEALTNLGLAQLAAGHTECEQTLLDGALQALRSGRLNIAAQAALGLADAVTNCPRLRGEAAALIDLLMQTAASHSTGGTGYGALGSIDGVTLGRLLARQSRLGMQVAAGTMATMALTAMARELRLLEGPDYVKRRLTLAEEMLIVATAVHDTNAQIVATHHRAIAAEITGDFAARRYALAALASTG